MFGTWKLTLSKTHIIKTVAGETWSSAQKLAESSVCWETSLTIYSFDDSVLRRISPSNHSTSTIAKHSELNFLFHCFPHMMLRENILDFCTALSLGRVQLYRSIRMYRHLQTVAQGKWLKCGREDEHSREIIKSYVSCLGPYTGI